MWRVDRILYEGRTAHKQCFEVEDRSMVNLGYDIHLVNSDGKTIDIPVNSKDLLTILRQYNPYGFVDGYKPKLMSVDKPAYDFLSYVSGVEEILTPDERWNINFGDDYPSPLDDNCSLWRYLRSVWEYDNLLNMLAFNQFKYPSHWTLDSYIAYGSRHFAWVIHFTDFSRVKHLVEKRRLQAKLMR